MWLGVTLLAPASSALAAYYTYGVISATEGTVAVAQGKGVHGVDWPTNAWGGHIGTRDPRPGGSPSYGEIAIQWYVDNWVPGGTSRRQSPRNATSSWRDYATYGGISSVYKMARTHAKACQDDALGPDACKRSDYRNHKW